ncbi:MAG: carbohydrate ABC transporter permease [Actinomycetota bacterium]|nr:carbohydrate ABC transporter permease [Actinomycetota bacterium]
MTRRGSAPRTLGIVALCVLFLLPLFFMVAGSLRQPGLIPPHGFEWLPQPVTWANYKLVFSFAPLGVHILNSLFVVVVAVPLTLVVASLAGFAIATAGEARQRLLVVISLVALMVPVTALWVPRFVMFKWVGLTDNLLALVTPALMGTSPFYVLLFALAYHRIPRSLYEAARLEGLSEWSVWRTVALPLGRPAMFAVAVLAFVFHWSNLIDPLLYLSSADRMTLPLGLRALQSFDVTNQPIFLAGAVIASIPAIAAFLLVQRAFFRTTLEV